MKWFANSLTRNNKKRKCAKTSRKIKLALARETAEYIRCSNGSAPNTFLAKIASNMKIPDGCVVIEQEDIPEKLYALKPRDLTGIGSGMEVRLVHYRLNTMQVLYVANKQQLRTAWGSIEGERMYDKLRGIEPYYVKNTHSRFDHSHVLPPEQLTYYGAKAVLHRLLQKACMRLRSYELLTLNISIKVKFCHHASFNAESACAATDNSRTLTESLETLFQQYPRHDDPPCAVGVSFTGLINVSCN